MVQTPPPATQIPHTQKKNNPNSTQNNSHYQEKEKTDERRDVKIS